MSYDIERGIRDSDERVCLGCAAKDAKIARLREAIKREADRHSQHRGRCEICEIAREGE